MQGVWLDLCSSPCHTENAIALSSSYLEWTGVQAAEQITLVRGGDDRHTPHTPSKEWWLCHHSSLWGALSHFRQPISREGNNEHCLVCAYS